MASKAVIVDPGEIEAKSFAIIDGEVGPHDYDEQQWPIVRRVIHTTADFDFVAITRFSPDVVTVAIAALRRGESILCDTNMVMAGINKPRLARFGSSLNCYVADDDVTREARQLGVTRSIVAARKGVAQGCGIYLIGNAPTALFELLNLAAEGQVKPSLIVGVPVGFVGAEESKQALLASGLPFITCCGRKGGSAIAATILNALMLLAEKKLPA